ncbi:cell division site-positioning protein MapZ family protein [Pseudolactococcus reticulitermitis]|uniref:Mid-cell-anchored protein Z n=1 Tax=Pseudolactococcus reticulitermitis TaxID=2025039 RepID=A0A224XBQ8_9LACT|nr:cell division site-positioning protein MapZ family protein [Lactococcus reticulitermitis]GAX47362.1 hypothetical protein RsY01_962 [Lactococcus reticulitermitis]
MAKKKKKTAYKEKTLAMKDAENLTVEQVAAKSDELETENLTKESSLDKYIRQHRSDIESAKKARQLKAAAASESLDKLVKTVRKEATAETKEPVAPEAEIETSETPEVAENTGMTEEVEPDFPELQGSFDTVVLSDEAGTETEPAEPALTEKSDDVPVNQAEPVPVVAPSATKISEPKAEPKAPIKVPEMIVPQASPANSSVTSDEATHSHKKPVIIGVCALLLLAVGGAVWYHFDQVNQKQATQTEKLEAKKSEEAKKTAAFNKVYATFFVDDKATKLKNDQFDHIDKLTGELDKLKNQSDYKTLQAKVAELKSEISAIKAMNGNFDKAVIKDGVLDKSVQVREGAKLSYTATENDALNILLKDAVAHGQAQQKAKTSEAPAPATPAQPVAPSAPANTTTAPEQGAATAPAGSASTPVSTGSGLSTAQYQAQYPNVSLSTGNSRVPVDPNADLSNPAYAWAPGIQELVLQKCRDRGYITGNAYILLPASIQKGNGYYNLYRPDGTYLVSINCKTGYFVGNGAGHADDLDY